MSNGKFQYGLEWKAETGVLVVHVSQEKAVVAHPPGFLIPTAFPKMARIFKVVVGDEPIAAKP